MVGVVVMDEDQLKKEQFNLIFHQPQRYCSNNNYDTDELSHCDEKQ